MTLIAFEVVKKVLALVEPRAAQVHGADLDSKVTDTLRDLGSKYSRLASARKPIIDYSDPATHLAYLYGYVSAHAAFVHRILFEGRALGGPLFTKETIRVTSLGGGPGSDLLGLLKYLSIPATREPVKRVRIRILDREPAWARICEEMAGLAAVGIQVELVFVELDVTNPRALNEIEWSEEDLVAMSFFVSEVCCLEAKGEVKAFFENAFSDLKSGCFVLYNDNRDWAFRDFFDARCAAGGEFELVAGDDAADMRLGSDEQASVLADYKARFDGRSTRLTGRTSYRLVRKK